MCGLKITDGDVTTSSFVHLKQYKEGLAEANINMLSELMLSNHWLNSLITL